MANSTVVSISFLVEKRKEEITNECSWEKNDDAIVTLQVACV